MKINSFVAIKILLNYDCFNKHSGCLHTTPFMGNFDSICVFLCFYIYMDYFGQVRIVSNEFRVAADSFGLRMVLGGCWWFQVVPCGFGWFRVVCCFSSYVCWIVFLKRLKVSNFIRNRFQHRCFHVKFAKLLRRPFFEKHLGWLLLPFC